MRRATLPLLVLLWASIALATPYIPPDRITTHRGETLFNVPPEDATYNHAFEFNQICVFQQPLQCEDLGVNFGGQREEETGGMYYIIETDNTLEAIQLWSRYAQLTGNSQYNDEIADAWTYAYTWPAWLESAGYYSAHNCAWALAAVPSMPVFTAAGGRVSRRRRPDADEHRPPARVLDCVPREPDLVD